MRFSWKKLVSAALVMALLVGIVYPAASGRGAVASAASGTTVELVPTDDAFTSAVAKDANANGTWMQLKGSIGGQRYIYMKFDLTALAGVEADRIENAKVWLKKMGTNGTAMTVGLRAVDDTSWSESTLTWNNAPVYGSQVLSQQSVLSTPDVYYPFDLDEYLKTQLAAGKSKLAIAFVPISTLNENMEFYARESTANTPKLVVELKDEPPAPTGLMQLVQSFGGHNKGHLRVVEFDATPASTTGNGTVGITADGAAPAAAADFPIALRFGTDGTIKAANAAGFESKTPVNYTAGQKYHVKAMINLSLGTYDLWLTPPNAGQPVLLAADYAFAASAPALNDIGGVHATADAQSTDVPAVANARLIADHFVSKAPFKDEQGQSLAIRLESDNSLANRSYAIKFDMNLTGNPLETDALISYADRSVTLNGFPDLAYIVRSNFGNFDVRNDNVYASSHPSTAQSNRTYQVEVRINPASGTGQPTRTYDVWIAPEGEQPVQLADQFKARNYANTGYALNNIGQAFVYSQADGLLSIDNHVVQDGQRLDEALARVNAASGEAAMTAALESNALGLPMERYRLMDAAKRAQVAQDVLAGRPAEGYAHALSVQAVFVSAVANRLDTENPTAPANVQVAISNTMQAHVSWTASSDDTGILYYKVFRDGALVGTVTNATSFVDNGLAPATEYTYVVKAYDLVLKEAVSQPATATSPGEQAQVRIPFSAEAIATAFGQPLLDYNLETHSGTLKWVMEWREEYEKSANALKLLTLLSASAPDYIGPDGVTTASAKALQHLRSVTAGGNEPGFAGNGLSGQGYMPLLSAIVMAKKKAPAIWNALTAAEKEKLDLMILAGLYGAKFAYDDENDNKTGIDATGNFDKEWNPNHRSGIAGAIMAMYYFEDAQWLNDQMRSFNYDDWLARLTAAGLTNVRTIYQNSGKTLTEREIRKDAAGDGFVYKGHPLSQPGKIMAEFVNYTFSHPVSPVGGFDSGIGKYRGYIVDGQDDLPNLGADSMGFEFDTLDANGKRSSLVYVFMGWKPNVDAITPVLLLDNIDSGLTSAETRDVVSRLSIGTTDMLYKNEHGYMTYAKGVNEGVKSLNGPILTINEEIWNRILNNPAAPMEAVNQASSAGQMRTALEASALGMILYGYGALSETGKNAVAQHVLDARPAAGYANKAAAQNELYEGVRLQALLALSQAQTAEQMRSALESRALGLYKPKYETASQDKKQFVAQYLLDNKPADGFLTKTEVREQVESALEPQGNQLRNLPPLASGEKRINLADYDHWPQQHGDAEVALWADDKTGAFSLTIDDNFENEHDTWRSLAQQYGFKFSWFVITSLIKDPNKWRTLAAEGHEIGSHTVTHEDKGSTLDPAHLHSEYADSQALLNTIEGVRATTLAYPFGSGREDIAAEYYIAARGTVGLPNPADSINYMNTQSLSVRPGSLELTNQAANGNSVEAMVKTLVDPNHKVWSASYYRGWSNMLVHSLNESGKTPSDGVTRTSRDLTQYLLTLLDTYRDQIWVGRYGDIVRYSQQRDTAHIVVTRKDDRKITFNLTDRMDDTLFDYPLTVKVRVDDAWSDIGATQAGEPIPFVETIRDGKRYLLVKAVPDKGSVSIVPDAASPLNVVNGAVTSEQMLSAIAAPGLGLDLGEFNALGAGKKRMVGSRLLEVRPADGYADAAALQDALDAAVEEANNAPSLSENASLSDLKVNGVTIAGFAPETYAYDIMLPEGTTALPVVSFKVADTGKATAVLQNAPALPGTAKVTVTAEDNWTVATYTLRFQVRISALQRVNTAPDASAMRTAIENAALGLVLAAYNGLTSEQKNSVAASVLTHRPATGYADVQAVQAELNAALPKINAPLLAHAIVDQLNPDTVSTANWTNLYGGTSGRKGGVYMKFNIASLAGLEADAIGDAKVQFFTTREGTVIGYAAPSSWEAPLTWNTQPLADLKNSNMAALAEIGRTAVQATGANYEMNITQYVKDAAAADKTELSLVLLGSNNTNITMQKIPTAFALSVTLATYGEPNPEPSPLAAVNEAGDAAAMQGAIAAVELDLNLTAYNGLTAAQRIDVAQALLDNRPAAGYAHALAVQVALDAAVAAAQPANQAPGGTLAASAEQLQPGQQLELTVGVSDASRFTGADILVHYDPQALTFATELYEGVRMLKAEAIASLQANYQVAAAMAEQPGTIKILLFTAGAGQPLSGTLPLFKLRASVKDDAQTGVSTAVSLSDFELTFEGEDSVWPDTTRAAVSLQIAAHPVEADKTALIAKIAHAQALLTGATVGANPGQYPQAAYDALADAIGLAEEKRDLTGVSQAAVDEAVASLGTAEQQFLNAVIPGVPADLTALNAAIAKAQRLHDNGPYGEKIGQYPQSAKVPLKSALDAAKAVGGSGASSQESVNAAAASLNGAIQTFERSLVTLVGGGATKVGIRDLSIVAKYYGVTSSDPNWGKVSAAAIDGGNEITIEVLAAVARMILADWAAGQ
uniref:Gellan lyase n=1 Tax=Bacillus sp. TaxID=1409 RepID=GELLY_BACSP|nr:RecName: Full=Gellan lyase; Contains: RecName: Full=N-terminal gellan lyase; Contains: RecName: Full=C-terminal gellan lyase; Flags: Precursor [Bacillus sp. (in: firmicutes)]BAA29068.1 gellan lyase precursor [Bacillus sp.] [Bacillus sp. (in: firmicutes)]